MADQNLLGDVADQLKDQLQDKLDPGKLLSEGNLKKKRGAFLTCFIAGFLLVLLSLGAAIAYNATRVDLLKQGVDRYVVGQGILSQSDADGFVTDTLDYLTGIKSAWEPAVTIAGHRVGVPEAFKTHMATVKGWVDRAAGILLAGAAIVLLLLSRALIGAKGSRKSPFSVGGYYLGVGVPLLAAAGLGLWGTLNFDGLWSWVHTALIPDGIFSAGEEIMKLFPVEVFSGYLQPVAVTFGICIAVTLALPLLLKPLSALLTAAFGKNGSRGGTAARKSGAAKTATKKTPATRAGAKKPAARKPATRKNTAD